MSVEISRRGVLAGAAGLVCAGAVAVAAAADREKPSRMAPAADSEEPGRMAPAVDPEEPDRRPAGPAAQSRKVADPEEPSRRSAHLEWQSRKLAELEKREGGRLGVAAVDTATGQRLEHRGNERFALCSTFKFLLAAALLQRVDRGVEHLNRRIEYGDADLLEYAPVSKKHLKEGGMALAEMCAAAVEWSDNTAANLLLKALGGPDRLTAFIRTLGDQVTRLDNSEPKLNVVLPGEIHDTTSPLSMVRLLSTLLFGEVLSPDSRTRLQGWMLDAKVGQHRLPAGLPPFWRIAHKTGTGSDQTNDVGVLWPPDRAPIIVAALYARGEIPQDRREALLADVGRIVSSAF